MKTPPPKTPSTTLSNLRQDLKRKLGGNSEPTSSVERRLFRYLQSGRIHPALLLVGPDREDKLAAAKRMAQLVLCKQPSPPCGQCSPCSRIEREIHPDVLWVRETEEDTIKIDLVRELGHEMEIGPIEAEAKICIIDECHRMSTASANAFLKRLEEPGPGRYFWLLTTQVGSILPTILSRCLQFSFKPTAESEALPEGWSEEFRRLMEEYLKTHRLSELVGQLQSKERALGFVKSLQIDLRQSLLTQSGTFASLSPFACLQKFEETLELEGRLRSNANYALMLESFLRQNFI